MQDKIGWIMAEAAHDGFYPTEEFIARVLLGEEQVGDPATEDYVREAGREWDYR